ncbi:hypothetical protein F4802DRAFT_611502 [Xylaria palmicola]|nr:hypothetical protein F4802DRAFT_611502 [Xylaria palmicola]
MRNALYDGQNARYAPYNATPGGADYFPVQQAAGTFNLIGDAFSYTSSPASQATGPSDQILTPVSEMALPLPGADPSSYLYEQRQKEPQGAQTPGTPLSQLAIITPPSSITHQPEETDGLYPQGSPTLQAGDYSLDAGVSVPQNWHEPSLQHLNPAHFSWHPSDLIQNRDMAGHAFAYNDYLPRRAPSVVYGGSGFHAQLKTDPEPAGHPNHAATIPSSADVSPRLAFHEEPSMPKSSVADSVRLVGQENVADLPALPQENKKPKQEEPYAKQIWRALMSSPNKAMILQQIYEWFRINTDRAKSDSKGWQNSIRHNLSMNAAFVKRERKAGAGGTGDSKKCTEWVLEDWAIRDGVQSTTRYRKGNPSRRGGSAANQRAQGSVSARAIPGRKSSVNANKNRSVGMRRSVLSRAANSEYLSGHNVTNHGPMEDRTLGYNYPASIIHPQPTINQPNWMGHPHLPTAAAHASMYGPTPYGYHNQPYAGAIHGLPHLEHAAALYPAAEMTSVFVGSPILNQQAFSNPQGPVQKSVFNPWGQAAEGGAYPN